MLARASAGMYLQDLPMAPRPMNPHAASLEDETEKFRVGDDKLFERPSTDLQAVLIIVAERTSHQTRRETT